MRHYGSFSLVILATMFGLLATQSLSVEGSAIDGTIHDLIQRTKTVKDAAAKLGKDQKASQCKDSYNDALYNLKKSLEFLKEHDKGSFNTYMSAVIADYSTCDDAYAEFGVASPFSATNNRLTKMAGSVLQVYQRTQ